MFGPMSKMIEGREQFARPLEAKIRAGITFDDITVKLESNVEKLSKQVGEKIAAGMEPKIRRLTNEIVKNAIDSLHLERNQKEERRATVNTIAGGSM